MASGELGREVVDGPCAQGAAATAETMRASTFSSKAERVARCAAMAAKCAASARIQMERAKLVSAWIHLGSILAHFSDEGDSGGANDLGAFLAEAREKIIKIRGAVARGG